MKTQALAQIPETKHAGGPVVCLSDVVKVYKEGDVEVSAIKGILGRYPRGQNRLLYFHSSAPLYMMLII